MNKKQKYIISGIISGLVILLLILIVIIVKISEYADEDTNTKINNKRVIGVYHNNNWNSNEAILMLNADMTCKYPSSSHECKWTISDKQITITLTYYAIISDNNDLPALGSYNTKEKCEEQIKKYEGVYNLINPACEGVNDTYNAILGEGGIILHEHLFNKVG